MIKRFISIKSILFFLIATLSLFSLQAQTDNDLPTIEDKIIGLQTGLFGFWGHYETKITSSISLRGEFGLDLGLRKGVFTNDEMVFALIPNLVVESRWYYSLERRIRKGKSIAHNSGFFLGIKSRYYPDWFVISSDDSVSIVESIDFIPKIGYRKVWNNHLSFESGFGIGKSLNIPSDNWDTTAELTFRIGYNF
ncbi:hypothetical protein [Gelatiniphilus marinus]|uniref:DUF3575 domain-containing protein n=1 Tax=Gelatiniphilus marinus TaxID=1759464 RepID=A0ABW5JQ59_9FLAO